VRHFRVAFTNFYGRIDVLILPAQWKGVVALTALEALAHGTPVIEPDSGGSPAI